MKSVYLDYASSTPVDPLIEKVYFKALSDFWANPSSTHAFGQKAKSALEKSRLKISKILNSKPEQIFFTSSATESNNLVIQGLVKHFLQKKSKVKVLFSSIEHDSVLKFGDFNFWDNNDKLSIEKIKVDEQGFLDLVDLESKIDDEDIVIFSLIYASNEIGTIQKISEIKKILNKKNETRKQKGLSKIFFHLDASQAFNYLKIDVEDLEVDFITISGQKIYCPKGISVLFAKDKNWLEPLFVGGSQEKNLRSSTENVPLIVAMSEAMKVCEEVRKSEICRLTGLRDLLIQEIQNVYTKSKLNGFWQKGDCNFRLANNLNFSFFDVDQEELLTFLDLKGFAVSGGSGCHSGSLEQSKVIQEILNSKQKKQKRADLRITLGRFSTQKEAQDFLEILGGFFKG